jgi:hypothetical protein
MSIQLTIAGHTAEARAARCDLIIASFSVDGVGSYPSREVRDIDGMGELEEGDTLS